MMEVMLVNMEALVVGPNDKLVLRLPVDQVPDDDSEMKEMVAAMHEGLSGVFGQDRYVIVFGDIEVTKVAA